MLPAFDRLLGELVHQHAHAKTIRLCNRPAVFTLGLAWTSDEESASYIKTVVDTMKEEIELTHIFDGSEGV